MVDSSFLTVTGVENRYSNSSPRSAAATSTETPLAVLNLWNASNSPTVPFRSPTSAFAGGDAGGIAPARLPPMRTRLGAVASVGTPPTTPPYTTGAAARSSGRSTVCRARYFGSYSLLMNDTGRPDTTASTTFVQSSPVVLSMIAQPSSVGSVLSLKISR